MDNNNDLSPPRPTQTTQSPRMPKQHVSTIHKRRVLIALGVIAAAFILVLLNIMLKKEPEKKGSDSYAIYNPTPAPRPIQVLPPQQLKMPPQPEATDSDPDTNTTPPAQDSPDDAVLAQMPPQMPKEFSRPMPQPIPAQTFPKRLPLEIKGIVPTLNLDGSPGESEHQFTLTVNDEHPFFMIVTMLFLFYFAIKFVAYLFTTLSDFFIFLAHALGYRSKTDQHYVSLLDRNRYLEASNDTLEEANRLVNDLRVSHSKIESLIRENHSLTAQNTALTDMLDFVKKRSMKDFQF